MAASSARGRSARPDGTGSHHGWLANSRKNSSGGREPSGWRASGPSTISSGTGDLYQDGTIEHGVKLTGVISNGALPEGGVPAYGTLVAPQVYGPNHQHIFCVRLDIAGRWPAEHRL
jgi:hypothetical protein